MKSRRLSREFALQALYQCDTVGDFSPGGIEAFFLHFHGQYRRDESEDDGIEGQEAAHVEHDEKSIDKIRENEAFSRELVHGVVSHLEFIDAQITLSSTHWSVARMCRVDRNILRIATFELAFRKDVPPKVSLNEAIEIAKRFGSDDSPMFVNGVLDHLAASLQKNPEVIEAELERGPGTQFGFKQAINA